MQICNPESKLLDLKSNVLGIIKNFRYMKSCFKEHHIRDKLLEKSVNSNLTAKPSNTVNDFTKCPEPMPYLLTAVTLQGEIYV